MSNNNNTCGVCTESFNKTSRHLIKCLNPECNFECCRMCAKTYILNRTVEPSCMSCNVNWPRSFMTANFEKVFMNRDYTLHRQTILFERENALFPATQPYVERQIEMERIHNEINEHQAAILQLENELDKLVNTNVQATQRREFIRKCPNNDCHGFLSTSLKCNLCGSKTCSDCREIINGELVNGQHICNKDILESVKLLERDTKPCPKCAALIHKIDGCNQMYCVECHTAFDWVTLRIEKGTIHNPHYFDYLRTQQNGLLPRNPLDVQCGRELDAQFVVRLIDSFDQPLPEGWTAILNQLGRVIYYRHNTGKVAYKNPVQSHPLVNICREVIHIRQVEMHKFDIPNRLDQNLQLRIDYMQNKITKEEFKNLIQKREKNILKKEEISQILGMFVNCMTELFYRLVSNNEIKNKHEKQILKEMNELRVYTNTCLESISKVYNCKCYSINEEYIFN